MLLPLQKDLALLLKLLLVQVYGVYNICMDKKKCFEVYGIYNICMDKKKCFDISSKNK